MIYLPTLFENPIHIQSYHMYVSKWLLPNSNYFILFHFIQHITFIQVSVHRFNDVS